MKIPNKELEKIKKWIIENYGEEHYKNGRACMGCIACQIWRAIDMLEQALEFGEDKIK